MRKYVLGYLALVIPLLFLDLTKSKSFAYQTTGRPRTTTLASGLPGVVLLPTTKTVAIPDSYLKVNQVNLHNVTGSSVTVYIVDGSANCNSGPCAVIANNGTSGISVGAGADYIVALNGQAHSGGIFWYASAANSIVGWISATT